jgi:hypothetical protein
MQYVMCYQLHVKEVWLKFYDSNEINNMNWQRQALGECEATEKKRPYALDCSPRAITEESLLVS